MADKFSKKRSQNITKAAQSFTPALPTTNFKTNVSVPTVSLKYCPETIEICEKVVRHLGTELAAKQHLKVRSSTWANWKKRYPEFVSALQRGREEHVKYTLKDHTSIKLKAVRQWEKMIEPQRRVEKRTTRKRAEDANGDPLTITRQDEDGNNVELGVYDVTINEREYWVEPNARAIGQAMGADTIDKFVLERFGVEYLDVSRAIINQLLGKMIETDEVKNTPEIIDHLLSPKVDLTMIRKLQVINETRLIIGEITPEEYISVGTDLLKTSIDAGAKIEMRAKSPFGNKSYAEVTTDYRNLQHKMINVFREAVEDERIDRDKIIEHVYNELGQGNAAGEILGAIIRSEPERPEGKGSSNSNRPENG